MRKGCRCPTNPFLPHGPERGQQWKPKGSAAARTCGEGGEEPGVALSKGGVADPAEIEHHGRPHHEHHIPMGQKKMSEEVSCWLVSHPPSWGRHHPGHSAELTMLSWRGTPGNPSGRGGWAGPRAGAPTRHTSPPGSPPATAGASASPPGPGGAHSGCSAGEPTNHPSTRY